MTRVVISALISRLRQYLASPGASEPFYFARGHMTAPVDRNQAITEYVAGGRLWRGVQSLPRQLDDLTRDLGDGIYERMLVDPQVQANVNVLRASVLADGVTLTSAAPNPDDDGYTKAQEIADFCTSVLADLETPLNDALWDLLSAMPLGVRVAEQVYKVDRNHLVLCRLKPKPRRAVALVVDPYMNVVGLVGARPGQGLPITMSAVDAQSTPGLIDRRKFAVFSFRPRDSDPRGSSILRSAYTPWWTKQQTWPELLKYLAQFASASLIGTVGEHASATVDATTGQVVSPVQGLLNALLAFKSGSALSLPYGTLVKALEVSGNGEAFHKTFDLCDRQITMAILHETLATMEGQHQARAAAETHQDILDTVIRQVRRSLGSMLRTDVLRPMVAYNFGDEAARLLTPTVSLGYTAQTDMAAMMTAVAQLARSSYLHPSQYAALDALMGLPPRDTTDDEEQPQAPPMEPTDDQGDADQGEDDDQEDDEQAPPPSRGGPPARRVRTA